MKIAILSTISGYAWAGTEEVWLHFAKRALEQRHEVMVAADHRVIASEHCQSLIPHGLQTSARRHFRPVRLHRLKDRLRPDHDEALAFRPDILLINSGSPFDVSYAGHFGLLVDRFRCKKVFYCHFNSDRLVVSSRDASRDLFSKMDHVVFVNQANRVQLENQLAARIPESTVILNTSRTVLDEPVPFPSGDEVRLANVARLETKWKGQDILAEVIGSSHWKRRNATVDCYGAGPEEDYINALIRMHGADGRMALRGYLRDVEEIWRTHHALVLPSRGEGTPLVALEAMMCGRPVITTDVGGNTEIIEDGETGFIAEAPTARSFGATMERAWGERHRWGEMGQAAHVQAVELAQADPPGRLLQLLEQVGDA